MRHSITILFLFFSISVCLAQNQSDWDKPTEFEKTRKYFKRAEWFYKQRAFPLDTIHVSKLNREFNKAVERKKHSEIQSDDTWNLLGPIAITSSFPQHWGACSGRVRALDIHPTNPDIVIIGAASGGLWKTEDGGENWISISNDFGSLTFGAVAIDPIDPNIVYAGTGEPVAGYSYHIYYGNGLYKSTNQGETWNKVATEIGNYSHTSDLLVNPNDNNYIYAAFSVGNIFLGNPGNGGIWRSTNKGTTWELTLQAGMASDLEAHPTNPAVIYAAVGGSGTNSGFHISTDYGATWTKSNTGLISSNQIRRMQISLSKSSPNVIYALIHNTSGTSIAYKSTDGGSNWSQMQSENPLGGYHSSLGWYDQGGYDLVIAADPAETDHVFVGNVELHESTDGQSFSVVRESGTNDIWGSPIHADYHRIVYAPSDPSIIYAGSDGGVFKSTNGGQTWFDRNNGISTIQLYSVGSHPTDRNQLVGGAQDNGNFRTTDGGVTNWVLETTGDGMKCFYDYDDPQIVYHSLIYGTVLKSNSGGGFNTYFEATPPFTSSDNLDWGAPFIIHPSDHKTLYIASDRIWKSTNSGSSWSPISGFLNNPTNSLAQNRFSPEVMVTAAAGGYTANPLVYVSTDGGENWDDVTQNIPDSDRYFSCVVTDPNSRNTIYVVKSGFGTGKIFRSKDLGETWENLTGNLPDIPHNYLLVDPELQGYMYAANDFGVYYTKDDGANWERFGNGLPIVPVVQLDYVDYDTERLIRAATYGRSVYEIELETNPNPYLTITSPTGGASLIEGTKRNIKWISNKLETLAIYLSSDNQQTWSIIEDNVDATATEYEWTIPSIYSEECWIKIVDKAGGIEDQISAEPFSISAFVEPILSTPQNGNMAVLHSPTIFEWEPVDGALLYHLQVMEDTLFSSIVYEKSNITDNVCEVDSLLSLKKYYWKVRAINETLTGPFSLMSEFVTSVDSPELEYPVSTASNLPTDFQLVWNKVTGADNYHLQLNMGFAFTDYIINDSTITDTTYTLTNLEDNKMYFWKVRASNEYGYGDFSNRIWFKTNSSTSVEDEQLPKTFSVTNNYPNPFNPSTRFNVSVPEAGYVEIAVYNSLGEEISILNKRYLEPGKYEFEFNPQDLMSGVYIYQVKYKQKIEARKMMYLK